MNVSQDGRVVEGLSTHRRIGTGADEDSLVTGVGGSVVLDPTQYHQVNSQKM